MILLGLKMLLGDSVRYVMMLCGLAFATLLMVQQSAIFWGTMSWTYAPMRVVRSSIWVTAPQVEQINDYDPLRLLDVDRVASVREVKWARPLFSSITYARLPGGSHKPVQLMGVDAATLPGLPQSQHGDWKSLRAPETVFIDEYAKTRLQERGFPSLGPGSVFELNEQRAQVVGIFPSRRAFSGAPFILTTFERATSFAPPSRRPVSFIMAENADGFSPEETARAITQATGLTAFTDDEFRRSTLRWWFKNTGVPGAFLLTVALGFLVGLVIYAQTFAMFVIQNVNLFATLRAMGMRDGQLFLMLLSQSLLVGWVGFGLGSGCAALVGIHAARSGMPPFSLTPEILVGSFVAVSLIAMITALVAFSYLVRIEPARVFRAN